MIKKPLTLNEKEGIVYLTSGDYFDGPMGEEFQARIDEFLDKGKNCFIVDMGPAAVITSPGISAIMGAAIKITEDRQGKIVFVNLRPLHFDVFKMAGILSCSELAKDMQEATKLAKK